MIAGSPLPSPQATRPSRRTCGQAVPQVGPLRREDGAGGAPGGLRRAQLLESPPTVVAWSSQCVLPRPTRVAPISPGAPPLTCRVRTTVGRMTSTTPHPTDTESTAAGVLPDPTTDDDLDQVAVVDDDEPDPFADVADDPAATGAELREAALKRANRLNGFVPIRKTFVQKPKASAERPSVLADMVRGKKTLALRAFLLIHALEPILSDRTWTLSVWAQLIGGTKTPHSPERVSAAFKDLEGLHLITRTQTGAGVHVYPLLEDGSGEPFVRASAKGADVGPGYLTIPAAFWRSGLSDRLGMPGLAMFLVALHETTQRANYQVTHEQTPTWFGISERTAERGYGELSKEKLLLTKMSKGNDIGSTNVRVTRTHRALAAPYSQAARAKLQATAKAAAQQAAKAGAGVRDELDPKP